MKVWIDGRVVSVAEANINVLDHGLLYGDGVFEGIRTRSGRLVDLPLHLERLRHSARALSLQAPPAQQLEQVVFDTLRAYAHPDAYLRLVLTRGVGNLGIATQGCTPKLFCIAGQIQLVPPDRQALGIRLITSSLRRPGPDMVDPAVKSLNYLNNVLSRLEATRQGADDALVLNAQGRVAEASGANVFAVRGDTLSTPPTSEGCLPGITRRRVLAVCRAAGLTQQERCLTRHDLLCADEVMLSGSGAGLMRVRSLDGVLIGEESSFRSGHRSAHARIVQELDRYAQDKGVPFLESPPSSPEPPTPPDS